jgi:hypothetical protein
VDRGLGHRPKDCGRTAVVEGAKVAGRESWMGVHGGDPCPTLALSLAVRIREHYFVGVIGILTISVKSPSHLGQVNPPCALSHSFSH